jgi:hypothetical protein
MLDFQLGLQFFLDFFNSKWFVALQIWGGILSLTFFVAVVVLLQKGGALTRHLRHLWIAWHKTPLPMRRMRKQWGKIVKDMESDDPVIWRVSIFQADRMLDEILSHIGYAGETMEEKLGTIPTAIQFPSLEDAWRARKIRNFLAQDSSYPLSREVAQQTLEIYKKIFTDIGIIS